MNSESAEPQFDLENELRPCRWRRGGCSELRRHGLKEREREENWKLEFTSATRNDGS